MYYFLRLCSLAVLILGFSSFTSHDAPWSEYFQNEQVKIEINAEACNNEQAGTYKNYVFLRITNKTSENIEVSFTKELWYDGVCSNCNGGDEAKTNIILKANETVQGTCDASTKELKMFQSMQNGSKKVLSKFELKDLTVSTLK